MIEAGIAVKSALRSLEPGISNPALRSALLAAQSTLERGGTLAEGMGRNPHVFGDMHLAMIEAAERMGRLAETLAAIASYEEAELELRRRVAVKLAYPLLVLHLAMIIPAVPRLFLEGPGSFLRAVGAAFGVLYGAVGLLFLIRYAFEFVPGGREAWGRFAWSVPVVGGIVRRRAISRFLRVLGAMYAAGIPVAQGIRHAGRAAANGIVEAQSERASDELAAGNRITPTLEKTQLFGRTTIAFVEAGETSGKLDSALASASEALESEARMTTNLLVVLAPLVLFLGVGAYVAWYVISFWSSHYGELLGR